MKRLRLLDDGVIYKNPEPGLKAECAFLPNVVPLDGEVAICIYRIGQAFYSTDGTLNVARSVDGGQTWVQEGCVWDVANDDRPYNYSAPHGFRLKDGTLVLNAFRMDFSDPRPQFNPQTGGHRSSDKIILLSQDDGQTWTPPRVMEIPLNSLPADTPSSIIELDDGRWWMGLELWKEWDDTGPLHMVEQEFDGFVLVQTNMAVGVDDSHVSLPLLPAEKLVSVFQNLRITLSALCSAARSKAISNACWICSKGRMWEIMGRTSSRPWVIQSIAVV